MRHRDTAAFTLIELLVVIGLIAGLTVALAAGLRQNTNAALQSGQSTVANLVTAARSKAVASGKQTRIVVQNDPTSARARSRYLRYLAVQHFDGINWVTFADAYLPKGVYIVPRDPSAVSGLIPPGVSWTRPSDNTVLRSTALRATGEFSAAVDGAEVESWSSITFSSRGTTGDWGALVLTVGQLDPSSALPLVFVDPNTVRGFSVSNYGILTWVVDRASF